MLLKPCTTSAGFMATPEKQRRVDFARLTPLLGPAGFEVLLDARVILLVRGECEASLYDTGKVLLKTTDEAVAQRTYDALRPSLEAAWD